MTGKTGEQIKRPTVWLLTDFGLQDAYVGTMKAVIKSICPVAEVYDLTHGIAPQQITQGAFVLESAIRYLPRGGIVVGVVDPGVGSARKAIAVRTDHHFFVAPDNGLLTPILASGTVRECVALSEMHYWLKEQSSTFHGRDLFAPVGAHLAAGVPVHQMGLPVTAAEWIQLPEPRLVRGAKGESWDAEIIYTDGFGNLITAMPTTLVDDLERWSVWVGPTRIPRIHRTFADVDEGEPVAYTGSAGRIEIGVRNGHGASYFGAEVGSLVRYERRD